MVRLEKEGNSFVLITGKVSEARNVSILINAIFELAKNSPDPSVIKEGLSYLDNCRPIDLRKELRQTLKRAIDTRK